MPGRRFLAVAVAGLLAVSCSAVDADPSVDPTVAAQRWQYTQLETIRSTFIDSVAPGIEQPDGYDDAGSELWGHYRDTQAAMDDLDSSIRDDVNEDTTFDAWIESDLDYIRNRSLALDMKILLKTVATVFSRRNAS